MWCVYMYFIYNVSLIFATNVDTLSEQKNLIHFSTTYLLRSPWSLKSQLPSSHLTILLLIATPMLCGCPSDGDHLDSWPWLFQLLAIAKLVFNLTTTQFFLVVKRSSSSLELYRLKVNLYWAHKMLLSTLGIDKHAVVINNSSLWILCPWYSI